MSLTDAYPPFRLDVRGAEPGAVFCRSNGGVDAHRGKGTMNTVDRERYGRPVVLRGHTR